MSDETEATDTATEDTRPQRQKDCDALIDALAALGGGATYQRLDMTDLNTSMLGLATLQVLIDQGLLTDEEVEAKKWDLMHQALASFLQYMEEQKATEAREAEAARKRVFLARPEQVRGLARSRND